MVNESSASLYQKQKGMVIKMRKNINLTKAKHRLKHKILPTLLTASLSTLLLCSGCGNSDHEEDFSLMETTHYNSLFLKMHEDYNFKEDSFLTYKGLFTAIPSFEHKDIKTIREYIEKVMEGSNAQSLSTVFITIDPAKLDMESEDFSWFTNFIKTNNVIECNLLLSSPRLSYWTGLKEEEATAAMEKYIAFVDSLSACSNAKMYFVGDNEWLIANPGNYTDDFTTTEELANKLMLLTACDDHYRTDSQSIRQSMNTLKEMFTLSYAYPDFSKYELVYIGDSIFGNYSGMLSVPGMIDGLTSSTSYNFGFGGATASDCAYAPFSFSQTLDIFLDDAEHSFKEDVQMVQEITRFKDSAKKKNLVFLINYGLNDYMQGVEKSGNAEDPTNYEAGLNLGINRIKATYPEAKIILLTPSYCAYNNDGKDPSTEKGRPLAEYISIATKVATDQGIPSIPVYAEMGINESNKDQYLEDGIHMTEEGRYMMSKFLIQYLDNILSASEQE